MHYPSFDARPIRLCVIPGDGIGSEVTAAACQVLEASAATGAPRFAVTEHPGGYSSYLASGDPLPASTVDAARSADGVLVGAMDVAQLPGTVTQPLRHLRRELGTVASVRRSRALPGLAAPVAETDLLVVRELTEGFYAGIEYPVGEHAACAVRVISREASARAARIAFEQATRRRRKVTAVHKRGAMPLTDTVFLDAVSNVAADFPDVEYETRNVDACAMEMIRTPAEFDTILCTNAFGDILSDVGAALAGGLGVAPSGCIGDQHAYFEPLHGTAPDIAGTGVANPLATILSTALMVEHLGLAELASAINDAVASLLVNGGPRTPDLGGTATTAEVTRAVCHEITGKGG